MQFDGGAHDGSRSSGLPVCSRHFAGTRLIINSARMWSQPTKTLLKYDSSPWKSIRGRKQPQHCPDGNGAEPPGEGKEFEMLKKEAEIKTLSWTTPGLFITLLKIDLWLSCWQSSTSTTLRAGSFEQNTVIFECKMYSGIRTKRPNFDTVKTLISCFQQFLADQEETIHRNQPYWLVSAAMGLYRLSEKQRRREELKHSVL